ncbi:hypothetical protein FACS18942_00030 [Planctomycetales bacterium]|nr:hypothetical protein FACS18942_00030 [Planctomycetales bacterium]GHT35106.1 hypothetical protein FACS189427_03690 [Planctomycetales bacterium]
MSDLTGNRQQEKADITAVFSPILILDPPKSGAENMAVDESLLDLATEKNRAVLRFYYWNEPTISLGYFQKDADIRDALIKNIPVVRRKSGGGAIVHDKELTYCLAVPPQHPFAKNHRLVLYEQFHRCIISVLAEAGISCCLFSDWKKTASKYAEMGGNNEFLCFKRFADGDIIAVYNGEPVKIAGSAQYRNKNRAVLQHGSILWDRSAAAPELPGILQLLENNRSKNHAENCNLTLEILRDCIIERVLTSIL